jgi:hypothetical protein
MSTSQKQQGGQSAWEYGTAAYGGPGEQRAVSAQDNMIAVKTGGRRRKQNKSKKGGEVGMTELAVPAILVAANNMYGRKSSMPVLATRRHRKSRRNNRRRSTRRRR